MKQPVINRSTRRFLVIWIAFHIIALFVNYAGLDWKNSSWSEQKNGDDYTTYYQQTTTTYFLTKTSKDDFDENKSSFWPFVKFVKTNPEYKDGNGFSTSQRLVYFNGIFYKYDFTEFLFYCVLPFIIIGLRRLWK